MGEQNSEKDGYRRRKQKQCDGFIERHLDPAFFKRTLERKHIGIGDSHAKLGRLEWKRFWCSVLGSDALGRLSVRSSLQSSNLVVLFHALPKTASALLEESRKQLFSETNGDYPA